MKYVLLGGVAVAALTLGLSRPSEASLMINLDDGNGHSVSVTDQSGTDFNSVLGAVTFIGSIGNFGINVTTGLSKPDIGSATQPQLDLNSIDITSQAGGKLTLDVTDTGFAGNGAVATFVSEIGGTQGAGGSISDSTFLDCTNAAFGKGTPLSTQSFSGTPFSGAKNKTTTQCSGAYSLTEEVVLSLPGSNLSTSFDASLAIPEPATLMLFGAGLIGIGLVSRRKLVKA